MRCLIPTYNLKLTAYDRFSFLDIPKVTEDNMLTYTNDLGSGNRFINTIGGKLLNNTAVKIEDCKAFIEFIRPYMNKEIGVKINIKISNRKTKKVWGSTKIDLAGHKGLYRRARIILYRASVWTFIHEMAHCYSPFSKHGPEFGKMFHIILRMWFRYVNQTRPM